MITKEILAQLEGTVWPTVMNYVMKYHPTSPDYLKVMEMSKNFSIWSTNMLLDSGFSSEKGKIGAEIFPGKSFFNDNILSSVHKMTTNKSLSNLSLHSGLMSYTQDMATALSLSNTEGSKFGILLNQVKNGPDVAMYDYHNKIKISDINTVNPTIADISSLFPIRIENKIRMSSESSSFFLSDYIKADPMNEITSNTAIEFLKEAITYKKNNTILNYSWISESCYVQEQPIYLKWLNTPKFQKELGELSVEFTSFGDTMDRLMCNKPKIESRVVDAHNIFSHKYAYKKLCKSLESLIKWCNMNNNNEKK